MRKHYTRLPEIVRFLSKVTISISGCWTWNASTIRGYASFGGVDYAYRWAHRFFNGPIPTGYQVDHLCRNWLCVNPNHLEAVTRLENMRRAQPFRPVRPPKMKCLRGHDLSGANLAIVFDSQRQIETRVCIACRNYRKNRSYLTLRPRQPMCDCLRCGWCWRQKLHKRSTKCPRCHRKDWDSVVPTIPIKGRRIAPYRRRASVHQEA